MITFFHLISFKNACIGKYFLTLKGDPLLKLTKEQHEAIIGLALGDLYLFKGRQNVKLRFKQGAKNSLYLVHLFELFYDYFSSLPKFSSLLDKRTNKVYYSVIANTRQSPIFNYYHSLFYNSEGKKVVLSNIGDLLSPRGLAYWLMDDGYCDIYTVYLCTDSFTLEEVELFIKVLHSNFGLVATLQKRVQKQETLGELDLVVKLKTLIYFVL